MVKLTLDLIVRGTSGYNKKKRDEDSSLYIKRLTHLYLEDKNLDDIGSELTQCRNLVVLYLYDNQLTKIPNLNFNTHLTHLYLQNNHITKVENLLPLVRLQKLYLGGNQITVFEGFEKLKNLQELHIENQNLPPSEKLLLDPRSLKALAGSLQVLNVSGNGLDSIRELDCLGELTTLMVADNQLSDLKELAAVLDALPRLLRLDLQGNPICHKSKYRDRIIVMSRNIEVLDGKQITDTARQFLRNWHASKETLKKKKDDLGRRATYPDFTEGMHELPPVKTLPKHASVPGYMMPGLPRRQFDELLAKSAHGDSRGSSASEGTLTRKTGSGILRTKCNNQLPNRGNKSAVLFKGKEEWILRPALLRSCSQTTSDERPRGHPSGHGYGPRVRPAVTTSSPPLTPPQDPFPPPDLAEASPLYGTDVLCSDFPQRLPATYSDITDPDGTDSD